MRPVLTRAQIREFDRIATEERGVPSLVLMENAGRGAAEQLASLIPDGPLGKHVVIVCGPGNNGGDGFVVARRLSMIGATVSVFLACASDRLSGDAAHNRDAWRGIGGETVELGSDGDLAPLEEALATCDCAVDALFGTGLDRDVEGRMRWIIRLLSGSNALRIALDIPSGIHADTGRILGVAVEAHHTLTFAALKQGLLTPTGAAHAGVVTVIDIGVPLDIIKDTGHAGELLEASDVLDWVASRGPLTHKGEAGRVVVIGGSAATIGAPLLAARGALRAGAGLVWVCSFPETAAVFRLRVLEEMTLSLDPDDIEGSVDAALQGKDVCVVGPGLGTDEGAQRVVERVLSWEGTKIIDADALGCLAGVGGRLASAKGACVLTPHPGEMGRLLGISTEEVEADRYGAVRKAIELTHQVVLLKGAHTVIGAAELPFAVNSTGGAALATAGAGDVLAGVIGALACTVVPPRAACIGAFLHGLAGDRWTERTHADRGALAREIADEIPFALASLDELASGHSELPH